MLFNMSEFDPVPPEYILPIETALRFIPERFQTGGYANAREIAMQLLVDDDPSREYEMMRFQGAGSGKVPDFFRFMYDYVDSGRGTHAEHIFVAACLYPVRDAKLNLPSAATEYMRRHGSHEDDPGSVRVFMGNLAIDAMKKAEQNEVKVRQGKLHLPNSPFFRDA